MASGETASGAVIVSGPSTARSISGLAKAVSATEKRVWMVPERSVRFSASLVASSRNWPSRPCGSSTCSSAAVRSSFAAAACPVSDRSMPLIRSRASPSASGQRKSIGPAAPMRLAFRLLSPLGLSSPEAASKRLPVAMLPLSMLRRPVSSKVAAMSISVLPANNGRKVGGSSESKVPPPLTTR